MAGSQKDQNRLGLYSALVANAVIFYGLMTTQRVEPDAWLKMLAEIHIALPAALGIAFITLLNSQLSAKTKERIVFWDWEHPLPGCRAFSWFLLRDPRADAAALASRYGPFPQAPAEQNRVWYRIYTEVRREPAVASISRAYLFARDYAALVALMFPVFGGIAFAQLRSPLLYISYTLFLLLQFALAVNAARKNAERLVTTAMAIASAK